VITWVLPTLTDYFSFTFNICKMHCLLLVQSQNGRINDIVPRLSALLGLPDVVETRIPLERDYSQICKFSPEACLSHDRRRLQTMKLTEKSVPTLPPTPLLPYG
jgi:hypothetical protein